MSWYVPGFVRRHFERWKYDRHILEKVVIGLNRTLYEIDTLSQRHAGQKNDISELQTYRQTVELHKREIEHRRTVAPIKFHDLASMAADLKSIGVRLTQMDRGLNAFGEEGLWGCDLAGATLETVATFRARSGIVGG